VAGLPAEQRPAARLALLTAFSSYQVTPGLVEDVMAQGHSESALIELTAWASLAAARRIGTELRRSVDTVTGGA
jgi:hypothetical protein